MGTSTDATLFFGFHIPEDHPLPWENETEYDDYDEWLLSFTGFDQVGYDVCWRTRLENQAEMDEWRHKKNVALQSVSIGVEIGTHCSDDAPMYYLYTSEYTAYRGCPKKITSLPDNSQERESLQLMAQRLGIEDPEIGWWLCSYWG